MNPPPLRDTQFWKEKILEAVKECKATLTPEQVDKIAEMFVAQELEDDPMKNDSFWETLPSTRD